MTLQCYNNTLSALDVLGCAALESVVCDVNALTSLDASGCTALENLECSNNLLTSLDVSGCSALEYLYCSNNALTSLDVSDCTALFGLHCGDNQLTALDLSGCVQLYDLRCGGNLLTSLDVPLFFFEGFFLDTTGNPLTELNVFLNGGGTLAIHLAANGDGYVGIRCENETEFLMWLIATPKAGASFINWTDSDDNEASTAENFDFWDATDFASESELNLTANFTSPPPPAVVSPPIAVTTTAAAPKTGESFPPALPALLSLLCAGTLGAALFIRRSARKKQA